MTNKQDKITQEMINVARESIGDQTDYAPDERLCILGIRLTGIGAAALFVAILLIVALRG